MRATDVCFPLHSTTSTPRFVRYRLLFETCASPMTPGLHPRPRDRWDWHFTMPDPLRQARIGLHAASSFFRATRPNRTSDIPVASGSPRGFSTPRSLQHAEAALTALP